MPVPTSALVTSFYFTLQLSGHDLSLKEVRAGTWRHDRREEKPWRNPAYWLASHSLSTYFSFFPFIYSLIDYTLTATPLTPLSLLPSLPSKLLPPSPPLRKEQAFQGHQPKTVWLATVRLGTYSHIKLFCFLIDPMTTTQGALPAVRWALQQQSSSEERDPKSCLQADLMDQSSQLQLFPPKYVQSVSSE